MSLPLTIQYGPIINDCISSAVISNHSPHDVKGPLAEKLKCIEHVSESLLRLYLGWLLYI